MFTQNRSSSSAVSVSFLLEVHQLGSVVQAGATKRKPTTLTERKNHNRSLWRRKEIVRSAYADRALQQMPFQVFCGKRLGEISKFSCHYSSTEDHRALHLRRVWIDITDCKLTTTCVQHWSQKIYNFPIVSVQHRSTCFPRKLQTARCMRLTLVNQFRVNSVSNNCDIF